MLKDWERFLTQDVQAYRIHKIVIAADTREEACAFYREEIGDTLPDVIEELPYLIEVCCDDGTVKPAKARISEEMDAKILHSTFA